LRCLTDNIDTSNPMGRLLFHLFGALAEYERDLIRERTMAGLEAARKRGRKGGRKPMLTNARAVKARKLLASGMTMTRVAEEIGVARSTVYKWKGAVEPTPTVHNPETDEVSGK